MKDFVKYGSTKIEFHLVYSNRKSLGITVNPDLSVLAKAPKGASLETVMSKVRKKAPWIIKQQNYFLTFHPKTPSRRYVSGESHLYLGRHYRLKIIKSLRQEVKLQNGFIKVFLNYNQDRDLVKEILNNWYKERSEIIFNKIYEDLKIEFANRKIVPDVFIIRDMKKRWGSCTPQKKIIINRELIKAPKRCIEYVIAHEMCHIKYQKHSNSFYALQSQMMPDWEFWKNKLEVIMS